MSAPPADREARTALTAWASILDGDHRIAAMPAVTNAIWLVESEGGPALVLKQLPEYPVGVDPVVGFGVLAHLQRSAVPVALPIFTDAGALLATVEERQWTLLPFLPHQSTNHELGPNAADAAFGVGAAIGHLDEALARYPGQVESFVDDPAKTLREALPQLPADAVRQVQPFADRLSQACVGLSVQLTHGDCNDANVLLDGDQVTGFIDIDHLPTGPRVRDLAYYLASRLRRHLDDATTADRTTASLVSALASYVAGYHHSYPLSQREVDAVVPLMVLIEVGGAHWSLHGWQPDLDNYRRNLASIRWLTSRFDDLVRAARGE